MVRVDCSGGALNRKSAAPRAGGRRRRGTGAGGPGGGISFKARASSARLLICQREPTKSFAFSNQRRIIPGCWPPGVSLLLAHKHVNAEAKMTDKEHRFTAYERRLWVEVDRILYQNYLTPRTVTDFWQSNRDAVVAHLKQMKERVIRTVVIMAYVGSGDR